MPTSLCTVFALSPSVVIVAIFLFGVRWFDWLVAFGWSVDWTRLGPFSRGGLEGTILLAMVQRMAVSTPPCGIFGLTVETISVHTWV